MQEDFLMYVRKVVGHFGSVLSLLIVTRRLSFDVSHGFTQPKKNEHSLDSYSSVPEKKCLRIL